MAYSTNDWGGGFGANITITNTGPAISSWTLRFVYPTTQRILLSQGWSANWTQSGAAVTATNVAWNGSLATGASTQIGFNGTYTGSLVRPDSFTLNGAACTAT